MKKVSVIITAKKEDSEQKKFLFERWKGPYKEAFNNMKKHFGYNSYNGLVEYLKAKDNGHVVKDYDKRARWDIWHNMPFFVRFGEDDIVITDGLSDNEIDTILKKLVKTL